MRLSQAGRRPGVTLIEVLVATAIFLIAVVAIMQLMSVSTDQALDVQLRSRAARLCQSKLNEYAAGVEAVGSAAGSANGSFEEDDEWQWSADVQADSTAANLYRVTVTVSRDTATRGKVEISMTQFVFDPAQRGQLVVTPPPAAAASGTSGTGTTTGGK